jgi:hypothetical protein
MHDKRVRIRVQKRMQSSRVGGAHPRRQRVERSAREVGDAANAAHQLVAVGGRHARQAPQYVCIEGERAIRGQGVVM